MTAFGSYGVSTVVPGEPDRWDRLKEEIGLRGFAMVPGVLDPQEVRDLNLAMDRIYARQCEEVGGEAALRAINDADVVRCLLAYDEAFLRLATHPMLIQAAKAILGEAFVLIMQNGVINRPDRVQFQTRWHRDLNYQHWTSSRPIALSALVCLEDFNRETGGTVFLPSSHKVEPFLSGDLTERLAVTPEAPAGSILLFDSMVFHRAGLNRSSRIRRAVNHVLGAPILAQQVDIPAMMARPAPADPWLAGYLGYRWNPVGDVATWRRRKIELAGLPAG